VVVFSQKLPTILIQYQQYLVVQTRTLEQSPTRVRLAPFSKLLLYSLYFFIKKIFFFGFYSIVIELVFS